MSENRCEVSLHLFHCSRTAQPQPNSTEYAGQRRSDLSAARTMSVSPGAQRRHRCLPVRELAVSNARPDGAAMALRLYGVRDGCEEMCF